MKALVHETVSGCVYRWLRTCVSNAVRGLGGGRSDAQRWNKQVSAAAEWLSLNRALIQRAALPPLLRVSIVVLTFLSLVSLFFGATPAGLVLGGIDIGAIVKLAKTPL